MSCSSATFANKPSGDVALQCKYCRRRIAVGICNACYGKYCEICHVDVLADGSSLCIFCVLPMGPLEQEIDQIIGVRDEMPVRSVNPASSC